MYLPPCSHYWQGFCASCEDAVGLNLLVQHGIDFHGSYFPHPADDVLGKNSSIQPQLDLGLQMPPLSVQGIAPSNVFQQNYHTTLLERIRYMGETWMKPCILLYMTMAVFSSMYPASPSCIITIARDDLMVYDKRCCACNEGCSMWDQQVLPPFIVTT